MIYRQLILDHYKHPHNKRELPDADAKHTEHNPLCGDVVTFFLSAAEDGTVARATFTGTGCAISQAAASLLTDEVRGTPLAAVAALTPEDVLRLLAIQVSATRMKCAVLGMVAAKAAAAETLEKRGPNTEGAGQKTPDRKRKTEDAYA